MTTSTFSGIYSYWSLNQVTITPHPTVLGLKVRLTSKEAYNYEVLLVFKRDPYRLVRVRAGYVKGNSVVLGFIPNFGEDIDNTDMLQISSTDFDMRSI